jgi:hypothetical protein
MNPTVMHLLDLPLHRSSLGGPSPNSVVVFIKTGPCGHQWVWRADGAYGEVRMVHGWCQWVHRWAPMGVAGGQYIGEVVR